MSEHSIDELQLQLRSARDRRDAANAEVASAIERLNAARVKATGLLGHVVEGGRWAEAKPVNRILVTKMGAWRDNVVAGPIIKKDGTPGERQAEVEINASMIDHGEYKP